MTRLAQTIATVALYALVGLSIWGFVVATWATILGGR